MKFKEFRCPYFPKELQSLGAEIMTGNLEDRGSLERAAQGVDAIFSMSTPFESDIETEIRQGTQVLAGVLLLTDLYVPLALVLLAPIITIILCMQLFIDPAGLPVGSVIGVLELACAWFYRDYFKSILVRKAVAKDAIATELKTVTK